MECLGLWLDEHREYLQAGHGGTNIEESTPGSAFNTFPLFRFAFFGHSSILRSTKKYGRIGIETNKLQCKELALQAVDLLIVR